MIWHPSHNGNNSPQGIETTATPRRRTPVRLVTTVITAHRGLKPNSANVLDGPASCHNGNNSPQGIETPPFPLTPFALSVRHNGNNSPQGIETGQRCSGSFSSVGHNGNNSPQGIETCRDGCARLVAVGHNGNNSPQGIETRACRSHRSFRRDVTTAITAHRGLKR